jgi:hypothetical protein
LYQVLALEDPGQTVESPRSTPGHPRQQTPPATPRQPNEQPLSIGLILRQMMERTP